MMILVHTEKSDFQSVFLFFSSFTCGRWCRGLDASSYLFMILSHHGLLVVTGLNAEDRLGRSRIRDCKLLRTRAYIFILLFSRVLELSPLRECLLCSGIFVGHVESRAPNGSGKCLSGWKNAR